MTQLFCTFTLRAAIVTHLIYVRCHSRVTLHVSVGQLSSFNGMRVALYKAINLNLVKKTS